jgi:hypothetical protein
MHYHDEPACIVLADRPELQGEPRYLTPHPDTFRNYQACPWATSLVIKDNETGERLLRQVTCKRWGCVYCAPRKIRKLAFLTKGAMPNRWIRLGVQPANYESPQAAWEDTSPKVPELFRKLRKQNPQCEYEYLRVCELHTGDTKYGEQYGKAIGYPHYHALLRAPYIDQRELSRLWGDLCGAPVVWIAKIDQSFSSFRYLTKYLTKLHRIEWTDRHVSYSKGFFRREDLEKMAYPECQVVERIDQHPWKFLAEHYSRTDVALRPDGSYELPRQTDLPPLNIPDWELGIREYAGKTPKPAWNDEPGQPPLKAEPLAQGRLLQDLETEAEGFVDQSF